MYLPEFTHELRAVLAHAVLVRLQQAGPCMREGGKGASGWNMRWRFTLGTTPSRIARSHLLAATTTARPSSRHLRASCRSSLENLPWVLSDSCKESLASTTDTT